MISNEVFNTSIQKFSSALRADEYKESVVYKSHCIMYHDSFDYY